VAVLRLHTTAVAERSRSPDVQKRRPNNQAKAEKPKINKDFY